MIRREFGSLVGETLARIDVGPDRITFVAVTGQKWVMWHLQDCCERVGVEDVTGDVADLIGTPILFAEERTSRHDPACEAVSFTWTFYELRTITGSVTIRWLGTSNGEYAESVNFDACDD